MATSKNVESIYPLTQMQRGMLFHSLQAGRDDPGTLHIRCDLDGPLDPDRFREAWERAMQRHPVLRSVLRWDGLDEPLQIVLRHVDLDLSVEDLRALRLLDQQERIEAAVEAEREQGLDLGRPPTMRLALFQTDEAAWHLVWTCHHVLLDGWSSALVLGDVVALYNASAQGAATTLPPAAPFRDYVRWLRDQPAPEAEAFWRADLAGITAPTPLPFDPPPRGEAGGALDRQDAELSAQTSEALRATAQRHRVTLGTVLQGAWALLLSRYSGREAVVFDATVSGRSVDLAGVEGMAGMLINTVPVRVTVGPEASAGDVLRQLHAAQADRVRHGHVALTEIHDWSEVPAHLRLSESLLVVENYPTASGADGPLRVRGFQGGITSSYPLTVVITPGDALGLHLVYDGRRFASEAMTRLLFHFERLLERMAEDPDRPVADLLPEVTAQSGTDAPPPPRRRPEVNPEAYVPPRDDIERRLVAIWEEVLDVRPVGMEDGFFDLGGQSMQAVQLLSRVERAFGTTPPMSLLFDGGTPARMAAALQPDAEAAPRWDALVPIQPGGTRMPLYCVHSYDGQVLLYRHLPQYLGPDQPVYGLQAIGLDGDEEPLTDVRDMAARYVEEIRSVQPEGPYALLSICFGIAVALEMARILTEAGEEVAALFSLDSSFNRVLPNHNPSPDRPRPTPPSRRPLRILWRLTRPETFRELPTHLAVHGRKALASVQRAVTRGRRAAAGPRELREWEILETTQKAWAAYRPTPYAGPVTLMRSSAWSSQVAKQWHLPVWTELARGGLTVHAVPGNHANMLTEPYVQTLAARLRTCLDDVNGARPEAADATQSVAA